MNLSAKIVPMTLIGENPKNTNSEALTNKRKEIDHAHPNHSPSRPQTRSHHAPRASSDQIRSSPRYPDRKGLAHKILRSQSSACTQTRPTQEIALHPNKRGCPTASPPLPPPLHRWLPIECTAKFPALLLRSKGLRQSRCLSRE
jgi:hypothetical protein